MVQLLSVFCTDNMNREQEHPVIVWRVYLIVVVILISDCFVLGIIGTMWGVSDHVFGRMICGHFPEIKE